MLRLDIFGSAVRDDFVRKKAILDFLVEYNQFGGRRCPDRFFGLQFGLEICSIER